MNIPERKFYEKIQVMLDDKFIILPQVGLSSIVSVKARRRDFYYYFNKINRKTIDFVIFQKPYFTPVLAIEYDGSTHFRRDRISRDQFVDMVINSAGMKMLHVKHSDNIDYNLIRKKILDHALV